LVFGNSIPSRTIEAGTQIGQVYERVQIWQISAGIGLLEFLEQTLLAIRVATKL